MGEFVTIEVTRRAPVAWLRLNRPDHRNAVTTQMVTEIYQALVELAADSSLSVVVFTGNGNTFCPGADLGRTRQDPPATTTLPAPIPYQSARLLHEMPQVTLAAINGGCAGAGFAWASACDVRVASDRARFSTAFLEVGLAGELGLAWTLERLLGGARARDLCYFPRKFTADEALSYGFVTQVFPEGTFAEEVDRLVTELGGRRVEALHTIKANFVDAERLSLADYIAIETERHQAPFLGSHAHLAHGRLAARGNVIGGDGSH